MTPPLTATVTSHREVKPRTALENGLPIDRLYDLARREGNSRKPWYGLHKWWARRSGSVFRMLILSAFAEHLPTKKLWRDYYDNISLGKTILDPFMGGGTTIIEGLRLGCNVVGVDINPVAWLVTKKEIDNFDPLLAEREFQTIRSNVEQTIQEFYTTRCKNRHSASIVHTIWMQKLSCKSCGRSSLLVRDPIILEARDFKVLLCSRCKFVFRTTTIGYQVTCPSCRQSFSIHSGVVKCGVFTCSHCHASELTIQAVKRLRKPTPFEMVCIEFLCEKCGRGFKAPDNLDRKNYDEVERKWKNAKHRLPYPKQRIPLGRENRRLINHGYRYYHQLFNKRQLLSLSLILKEILRIRNLDLREFFLLVLSSALETNNKLCKYESKWNKVSALFTFPGYHPVERFGENNVWGTKVGRGTFLKRYLKLKSAKFYLQNPYERVYIDSRPAQRRIGGAVVVKPTLDFPDIELSKGNSLLTCQSSTSLKLLPDKSIDAVITDPPYFNNIMYSELSDFFYVWLRIALKKEYSWFSSPTCTGRDEIVLDPIAGKRSDHFLTGLRNVFSESRRVLKDDGLMALTFHHTSSIVWGQLKQVLEESGWKVTSVSVVRSEGNTGYRKGQSIGHDACIVVRKATTSQRIDSSPDHAYNAIVNESVSVARKLVDNNALLKDADLLAIVMAQSMKLKNGFEDPFLHPEPFLSAVKQRIYPRKGADGKRRDSKENFGREANRLIQRMT